MFRFDLQHVERSRWRGVTTKIVFSIKPESPLDVIPVSKFLKTYLHEVDALLPKKLESKDLRGRPFESFPETQTALQEYSEDRDEELFFSGGTVLDPENPDDEDKGSRFTFSLKTHFKEYTPGAAVIHDVRPESSGPISLVDEDLSPQALCQWLPLKLERFRFGIEQYKKQFLGSMIGLVPTIDIRFYLEVSEREVFVLCEQESQPRGKVIPLGEHSALRGLEYALRDSMQYTNLRQTIIGALNK
jgi:hypothetical protein